MINKIKVSALTILFLVAFSSCKKSDNSASNQVNTLNTTVQQGKWRVSFFSSSSNDETSHYTGYEFQFITGGTITATKTGSSVSGTWSNGSDDSTIKLVLNFGVSAPFLELNNDWHVTQQSSTIITLEDVSGGSGGTDYLTFAKI